MTRLFLLSLSILVLSLTTYGQKWTTINPDRIALSGKMPSQYHLALADTDDLASTARRNTISLPLPDGSINTFTLKESTNFHPRLAARYPGVKSYLIESPDNALIRGRISMGPSGLHGVIDHPDGEVYLDPYQSEGRVYYISYYTRDYQVDPEVRALYEAHEHSFPDDVNKFVNEKPKRSPFKRNQVEAVNLSTYRFALACTGEYGQRHGGTIEGVLDAMNVALDRINFVLQSELAIRLELIENNDSLIFFDGQTDPFTNGNASQLALENNNYLLAELGSDAYDIGHVFATQCSNVVGTSGGVGTVCGSLKGFGSSCEITTTDRFYIGVVCHELGHQFGAEHTWNNCPNAPDNQFNGSTAFEPGSGTTIMSYAGSCGNQNTQNREDPYYHNNSIEDIYFYTQSGGGSGCAQVSTITNQQPSIDILHPDGFYIPIETPFRLSAVGSDPDDDSLTYNWEQYDPGVGNAGMTSIGDPQGDAPIFRSVTPSTSPTRYFPRISSVINNNYNRTEVLPTYDRKLTFRATVRDNNLEGGGVAWDEMFFRATADAGPFYITDTFPDTLHAGDYMALNWEVAGTDLAPVNCKSVDIFLSTDGGFTYTDTLLLGTTNDGSEPILIPEISTDSARIMVAASNNVFYDINDQDIIIRPANQAGFAFDVIPHQQEICLPSETTAEIVTFTLGDFDDSLDIVIVDKPASVSVDAPARIAPGDPVDLTLDFTAVTEGGNYEMTIATVSSAGDSIARTILVSSISTDFSDLTLASPQDGESGLDTRPTFSWSGSARADGYRLEVSTTPSFLENTISFPDLSQTEYTIDTSLEVNTIYYWRLQPFNSCAAGDYTDLGTFQTVNLACEQFSATDLPQNISQSVIVPVESSIEINTGGMVSDINVVSIDGFHESFGDLIFNLVGPDSTAVNLVNRQCGFSNRQFTFGFDSESQMDLDCQSSFSGQTFSPEESLDSFNGKDILGNWTLQVIDSAIGSGGVISGWQLEVCGSLFPTAPTYERLDTVEALFAGTTIVDDTYIQAIDDETEPENLVYTITQSPVKGELLLNSVLLSVGDQFSQEDINTGALEYTHTGNDTLADQFSFTLMDDGGGWIAPTSLSILINTSVSSRDFLTLKARVFPNPASDRIRIELAEGYNGLSRARLFDMQGKLIFDQTFDGGTSELDVSGLPSGEYILHVKRQKEAGSYKVLIE